MTVNTIPSVAIVGEDGMLEDNPKLAMVEAVCITWSQLQ